MQAGDLEYDQQYDETNGNKFSQLDVMENIPIDPEADRYPFCIVWTVLPFISWFIPIIGHTGIATSDGITHDFAGPYTISVDNLAFGKTLKYVKLDKNKMNRENYNKAIVSANKKYQQEMHNLFCNNCHSHVAYALNLMEYKGKTNWTMIGVWWLCIAESTYVNSSAIFKTYCGFIFFAVIYLFLKMI